MLPRDRLVELGRVIEDRTLGRQREGDITIADLTGVAVQDIVMADLVREKLAALDPGAGSRAEAKKVSPEKL